MATNNLFHQCWAMGCMCTPRALRKHTYIEDTAANGRHDHLISEHFLQYDLARGSGEKSIQV